MYKYIYTFKTSTRGLLVHGLPLMRSPSLPPCFFPPLCLPVPKPVTSLSSLSSPFIGLHRPILLPFGSHAQQCCLGSGRGLAGRHAQSIRAHLLALSLILCPSQLPSAPPRRGMLLTGRTASLLPSLVFMFSPSLRNTHTTHSWHFSRSQTVRIASMLVTVSHHLLHGDLIRPWLSRTQSSLYAEKTGC